MIINGKHIDNYKKAPSLNENSRLVEIIRKRFMPLKIKSNSNKIKIISSYDLSRCNKNARLNQSQYTSFANNLNIFPKARSRIKYPDVYYYITV